MWETRREDPNTAMDESEQSFSVADFECGYCRRKFTKKEHLRVRRDKGIL